MKSILASEKKPPIIFPSLVRSIRVIRVKKSETRRHRVEES